MKDGKPVNWVHEYQQMREERDKWKRIAIGMYMEPDELEYHFELHRLTNWSLKPTWYEEELRKLYD